MGQVVFPLTGAGDASAAAWTDLVAGAHYQVVKLASGDVGSTVPIVARETTPGSTDPGLVTRNIPTTAFNQAISGTINADLSSAGSTRLVGMVTINNPTTAVEANLSSLGSTRLVGQMTVANPTTAVEANLSSLGSTRLVGQVTINNPTTGVTITNGTTATDATLTSLGSTRLVGQFTMANPTTAVEANLSSVGSTKLVGQVTINNPTTSVTLTSGVILGAGSSANMLGQVQATGTTKVDVSSGVVLGAGSTANALGSVALLAGSTGNALGSVALLNGTSANMLGTVVISSGTTAITLGSAALLAGGSTIGSVQQGAGSSANFWYTQPLAFSSAGMARTTVNTTVDISIIAANAARKALVIANLSTAQIVALGMSTGAVTTGLTNANLFLPPNSQLVFGYSGGLPLFTGPFRGINISSTVLAGGVAVMEFT